jgi:small GTP-binding protein
VTAVRTAVSNPLGINKLVNPLDAVRKRGIMVDFEPDDGRVRKVLKFLVVGEPFTGKTSLVRRYAQNSFTEHYRCTIGADFAHKDFDADGTTTVSVQLWDVSGQERLNDLTRMYYLGSVGALVVFDVTKPETLERAVAWKKGIDDRVVTASSEPIPVLLVGNKIDLAPDGWEDTIGEIDELRTAHHFIGYVETSARTAVNIEEAVHALVDYVLENSVQGQDDGASGVQVMAESEHRQKKCCR